MINRTRKTEHRIRQIAFYGKGGIGKSTIASNIAAVYAERGLNTMVIGCDPKSDCTRNLRGDVDIPTVSDVLREKGAAKIELSELMSDNQIDMHYSIEEDGFVEMLYELVGGTQVDMDEIVHKGYKGVFCVEAGGPEPAVGCAGRGVIVTVDLLKRMGVYDGFDLDVIIYDVLGDIVCGGLGVPLRKGLAHTVYTVTSADYLSIYAANNICKGIKRHAKRGGALLGGFIYNMRGTFDDIVLVEEFASKVGTKVVGALPNDPLISESEIYAKTVIEYKPDSEIADQFRELASRIFRDNECTIPEPLSNKELSEWRKKIKEEHMKVLKLFVVSDDETRKPVHRMSLVKDYGIEGDKHAGDSSRQVSILSHSSLGYMKEKGYEVEAEDFHINMLVDGLDPHNIRIGDILEVKEVLMEVIQIGSSSEKQPQCDIYKRYGMCIMQTEGIFAKVIKGGNVAVSDNMKLKPKNNYAEVMKK